MLVRIVPLCCCLVLAACDSQPQSQDNKTNIEKTYSGQLDSLDKAKSVEQTLKEKAEQRKKQISEQGG